MHHLRGPLLVLFLTGVIAGCVVRQEVKPARLPLEPSAGRSQQAVVLVVKPELEAREAIYRNPFVPPGPATVLFVLPVGSEVADAWERALGLDFAAVRRIEGVPAADVVAIEIAAVDGRAFSAGLPYRVDVEVTSLVREPGGRTVDTVVVRGRSESARVTVPGGLSEATALAVKQAAELFRRELASRPALAARLGLPSAGPIPPSGAVPEPGPAGAPPRTGEAPVARAPAFDPEHGALAFHLGMGGGWNDQVDGHGTGSLDMEGGLGWAGRRLGAGLAGGYAVRGESRTFSIGLAAGASLLFGDERRFDLRAEVGFRTFAPTGQKTIFGTRHVSGGGADLPYAAARAIAWFGTRQLAWGMSLWVDHTLDVARTTYLGESCSFLGCTRGEVPVRFGGTAAGLTVVLGAQVVPEPGAGRPARDRDEEVEAPTSR